MKGVTFFLFVGDDVDDREVFWGERFFLSDDTRAREDGGCGGCVWCMSREESAWYLFLFPHELVGEVRW